MTMKSTVFRVEKTCSLVGDYERFGEKLLVFSFAYTSTMKMEAISSSEASVGLLPNYTA
jgi:hypothetical protein